MGAREDQQDDLAAFQSGPLTDLTLQDALIICAVYAVQADPDQCDHIKALAQKHPLFAEDPEGTSGRVNKFTNLMQVRHPLEAVDAAIRDLNSKHRREAFAFAVDAALAGKPLTEDRKKLLQALATKLALDTEFVNRKLTKIKSTRGL